MESSPRSVPPEAPPEGPTPPPGQAGGGGSNRLWLDFGPLAAFLVANMVWGIFVATAVLIAGVVGTTLWTWRKERKLSPMGLFTLVAVLIFGGLTLWLQDDVFIKVKLTIINALLGLALFVGLATGRLWLKTLLGQAVPLTDEGWTKLTVRYAVFFFVVAAINELIWRNVSTNTWALFKSLGVVGLTLVFSILQVPLFTKHMVEEQEPEAPA